MLSKYPWNQSIAVFISPTKSPERRSSFNFSNLRSRNSFKNDQINNSFRFPSISSKRNPQPFIELIPQSIIKNKSDSKNIFLPNIHRSISKQFPENIFKCQHLSTNQNDNECGLSTVDKEFQEYLQQVNVKCADWLIKYVFDRNYDSDNDLC